MKPTRRMRLAIEQLEDRCCPSLTIRSFGGNLTVSGAPTGNLLLTETSPNVFRVQDGTFNLGSYTASNVTLNLTNHFRKSVNVNLNGNTLGGNLTINEGAGDTSSLVDFATGVFGGRIGGILMVSGGSGLETFLPGFRVAPVTPVASTLSVGGDIFFTPRPNLGPMNFNVFDTGVLFGAGGATVTVGGNVLTTAADNLGISANTRIGGSLTMLAGGEQALPNVIIDGTVNKDVTVVGGFGGTGVNFIGATVGGNLLFLLGNGRNTFDLDAATTIGGSGTILGGVGGDTVTIEGTVNGSLSVNLGDGTNTFGFAASANVFGNLSIAAGNGTNTLGTLAGTVAGNLVFTIGNGNTSVTIVNPPGGTLSWTSGNGNDSVTLGSAASTAGGIWNVNLQFGNGDDSLTLSAAAGPQTITGRADGGGHIMMNTYTQGANWTPVNFTLVNFP